MGLDSGLHPLILIFLNRLHAVIAPEASPQAHMEDPAFTAPVQRCTTACTPLGAEPPKLNKPRKGAPGSFLLADGLPRC